ncbi:MAG: hypothetical protein MJ180_05145 [Candidatus Gastranaerophilales bacterium]|nr:hypothetical protein [Candidatus Gastranaerophilales bacterium]
MKDYNGKTPSCELEKELFEQVENNTPDYIKENSLFDINNNDEFIFTLKKEHLYPYDVNNNPEGLNLKDWFANYEKEARVSTAGIRGPQNILYPHDTRFPINTVGIMLATLAKALVLKEKYANVEVKKILGREVRYNSEDFMEIIARIQAAQGIKTLAPKYFRTIPIWLASFLAFKLDLAGGEFITSSHGISVKNATKDLNNQGSQYLPEESMEFVEKIRKIFEVVENEGSYDIRFSNAENSLIDTDEMEKINDGVDLYTEYLKDGVANKGNIDGIKNINNKIYIESVGGSAYRTLSRILKNLDIENSFNWLHTEEDPFFHSIGKSKFDPKGNRTFYDYSVDAAVMIKNQDGTVNMPVIDTLNYDKTLKEAPVGTVILITDPDHDRLTITQIETTENKEKLSATGIDFVPLNDDRILCVYTANQAFLMIMDFWAKGLKASGVWNNHPRFIIKTTASALSWDEWAKNNDVKTVNVPVGFKEIANILKKAEKQISENKEVVINDVFGNDIVLGKEPRLIFAGEESGGMIIGAENLIQSYKGRNALAMREKSATEAILVASALVASIEKENKLLSDYLKEVFITNKINGKFDVRKDISYYNESESDIEKLKLAKKEGEGLRTKNDLFYLTLALAKRDNLITLDNIKEIFKDAFATLDFDDLTDVKFVGDGTYLEFKDKYVEIRPSGTDAKTKAYSAGLNKNKILEFATTLGTYEGDLTEVYKKYIKEDYYQNAKKHASEIYDNWARG